MYIKIGGVPGAEYLSSPDTAKKEPYSRTIQLSGFSGFTILYVDAYDNNDNRYYASYHSSYKTQSSASKPYIVEKTRQQDYKILHS